MSPQPFAPSANNAPKTPEAPGEGDGDTLLAPKTVHRTATPKRFKVLLHNDDYTTMDYVVFVLQEFFHRSESEALHIMLSVHHEGAGVAGIYTRDVAETKVAQVEAHAKENQMPLRLSLEPE